MKSSKWDSIASNLSAILNVDTNTSQKCQHNPHLERTRMWARAITTRFGRKIPKSISKKLSTFTVTDAVSMLLVQVFGPHSTVGRALNPRAINPGSILDRFILKLEKKEFWLSRLIFRIKRKRNGWFERTSTSSFLKDSYNPSFWLKLAANIAIVQAACCEVRVSKPRRYDSSDHQNILH